jgi:4-hydroxybenzoyl-CoA thioesterase
MYAEVLAGNPRTGVMERAVRAILIFVAVGEDRKPVSVPVWTPATEREKALHAYALRIADLRHTNEAALQAIASAEHAS